MAKYTVQEAIWIATALMAEEVYSKNPNANREDMYFKQADIARRAKKYTDGKVDAARVSQWLNGLSPVLWTQSQVHIRLFSYSTGLI